MIQVTTKDKPTVNSRLIALDDKKADPSADKGVDKIEKRQTQ